jgi:hypothetical protein
VVTCGWGVAVDVPVLVAGSVGGDDVNGGHVGQPVVTGTDGVVVGIRWPAAVGSAYAAELSSPNVAATNNVVAAATPTAARAAQRRN